MDIIQASIDVSNGDEVLEVDIDKLSNETLHSLRAYVDDVMNKKKSPAPVAPSPAKSTKSPKKKQRLSLSSSSSDSSRYDRHLQ